MKFVKKYSHLVLFAATLLNTTGKAQTTQFNSAAQNILNNSKIEAAQQRQQHEDTPEIGPLQSLSRAAATLAMMTVEIVSPSLCFTDDQVAEPPAQPIAAPASAVRQNPTAVYANPTPIAWPTYTQRNVNLVSQKLKGQTTGNTRIDEMIVSSATKCGVEPLLLFSVMHQESAFNKQAVSSKGARGLMQLMPATAARFGVKNIFDPQQNIDGAAQYLRFLLDTFDGNVSLALAGYNAGEGAVKKYGNSVPPYPETINYVRRIRSRYITLISLDQ